MVALHVVEEWVIFFFQERPQEPKMSLIIFVKEERGREGGLELKRFISLKEGYKKLINTSPGDCRGLSEVKRALFRNYSCLTLRWYIARSNCSATVASRAGQYDLKFISRYKLNPFMLMVYIAV